MLSRQKNYDFNVTQKAASEMIIPVLKQLINGNSLQSILQHDEEEMAVDDETTENTCKNCGLKYPTQHDLRNHID